MSPEDIAIDQLFISSKCFKDFTNNEPKCSLSLMTEVFAWLPFNVYCDNVEKYFIIWNKNVYIYIFIFLNIRRTSDEKDPNCKGLYRVYARS